MKKYFEYEFNEIIKNQMIEYYNSQSGRDDLDNTERKVWFKIDRIAQYIPYKCTDYICDVGCSDGALLRHIRGKYDRAIGLDISEKVIKENTDRNNDSKITYRTYDGSNLNITNEYDKVFLMDVLEHAFEPNVLITSIYKSLKKGGVLIMQVPTTGWLSELLMGKYHFGHLRYYDQDYLSEYLKKNGFDVLHIQTFNSVPWSTKIIKYPRLFNMLNLMCSIIPHSLFPWYGSVAAIARK